MLPMTNIIRIFCFISSFTPLIAQQWSIMSYQEYAKTKHARPYTFSLSDQNHYVYYFGANHSLNPDDQQYPVLEAFWQEFLNKTRGRNCVVLVEGSLRPLKHCKEEAILGGAEGTYITLLAEREKIDILCPEPQQTWLTKELLKEFPEEEVAYAFFAQDVFWHLKAEKIRRNFNKDLAIKEDISELQKYFGTTYTLELLKDIHQKIFSKSFDDSLHEDIFYRITNPVEEETIINKVISRKSMLRDTAIVNCIEDLIGQNKNIFVVYGCTHAIMQEAAIKTIWEKTQKKSL